MELFGKFWWVVYVLAILSFVAALYATSQSTRSVALGSVMLTDSQLFTISMSAFLWAISISSAQPTGYLIISK